MSDNNSDPGLPSSPDLVVDKLGELASEKYALQDTTSLHIRASALVGRLKAQNRAANGATRYRKEATSAARLEMDQAHLGLQNLQYEKRHLEREIEKCRQFASIYQDIPLYRLEDFEVLAPEAARTSEVLADEHQLMLNRLSFELAERQRLDLRKKELLHTKEELLKQSKTQVATAESVKSQIELLVKTATDIQNRVDELVVPITLTASESTS